MKKLLVCLLVLCSGSVIAENEQVNYLCTSKVSAGLWYNKDRQVWSPESFDAGVKYLVKVNDKKHTSHSATAIKYGGEQSTYYCNKDLGTNEFLCKTSTGQFVFSQNELRFIRSYMHGYNDGIKNNDNTPVITGGTCSPL